MREAYATSRLAVLPALDLSPRHNFEVDREWRWESYVDSERAGWWTRTGANIRSPLRAARRTGPCRRRRWR